MKLYCFSPLKSPSRRPVHHRQHYGCEGATFACLARTAPPEKSASTKSKRPDCSVRSSWAGSVPSHLKFVAGSPSP